MLNEHSCNKNGKSKKVVTLFWQESITEAVKTPAGVHMTADSFHNTF